MRGLVLPDDSVKILTGRSRGKSARRLGPGLAGFLNKAGPMRGVAAMVLALTPTLLHAEPSRLAGSEASLRHAASLLTFAPDAELTYDPIVVQTIAIEPAYRWNARLSLRAHLGLETELTDSDVTSEHRQPLLDDAWVQGTTPFELGKGLEGTATLRLTLPTSRESRARERILGVAPSAIVRRAFPVRGVIVRPFLGLKLGYTAATATTLMYDAPTVTTCDPGRDRCDELDHDGARSVLFSMTQMIGADVEWPFGLSFSAQVWWIESRLHGLADARLPDGTPLMASDENTDWRYSNLYLLGFTWPIGRLKLGAGFQTVNPQRAPDTDFYRPFFNRYTQVYLETSFVY